MIAGTELALFFALVLGVVLLPGMDMAYVTGQSIVGGLRAGVAAVLGIVTGGVCHMVLGAAGVALVVKTVPGLFAAMLLAGAAYVAWIGIGLWRASGASDSAAVPVRVSPSRSYRGALLTSLLNPKAYLFTLALVPQFVHPVRDAFWWQVAELTVITNATQAAVYGALAVAASRGSARWDAKPGERRVVMRVVGAVLMLTAAVTVRAAFAS
jgi:threonine/homoserine/homoserine lactone efflux protein